jgi:hypothetical protein
MHQAINCVLAHAAPPPAAEKVRPSRVQVGPIGFYPFRSETADQVRDVWVLGAPAGNACLFSSGNACGRGWDSALPIIPTSQLSRSEKE